MFYGSTGGGGGGGGLGSLVVSFLGSLFGGLFGGSSWQDAFTAVSTYAQDGFNFFGGLTEQIYDYAKHAFSWVRNVLRDIWENFFKQIFRGLLHAVDQVHKWLEAHLGGIIRFIQKVRSYVDRIFRLYVKPFLNMLQHIRQVLAVLRALHVKWAIALDRRLLAIENQVSGVFLQVRGILNGVIDIMNLIVDPMRLLRQPTLVLSFRRTINALIRVTTGRPPGYFFPSPRKGAGVGLGRMPANFNFTDPASNPPASSYLSGSDGLGVFSGFMDVTPPENSAVDDVQLLDYFDDGLYDAPECDDAVTCLERAFAIATSRELNG